MLSPVVCVPPLLPPPGAANHARARTHAHCHALSRNARRSALPRAPPGPGGVPPYLWVHRQTLRAGQVYELQARHHQAILLSMHRRRRVLRKLDRKHRRRALVDGAEVHHRRVARGAAGVEEEAQLLGAARGARRGAGHDMPLRLVLHHRQLRVVAVARSRAATQRGNKGEDGGNERGDKVRTEPRGARKRAKRGAGEKQ